MEAEGPGRAGPKCRGTWPGRAQMPRAWSGPGPNVEGLVRAGPKCRGPGPGRAHMPRAWAGPGPNAEGLVRAGPKCRGAGRSRDARSLRMEARHCRIRLTEPRSPAELQGRAVVWESTHTPPQGRRPPIIFLIRPGSGRMSSPRRIKKIIRGVGVDPHTTPEAAGRPIVFLIRVGTATCSRSLDSGGVDVGSHTTLEQGTLAGKGGMDVDSHTTLEQGAPAGTGGSKYNSCNSSDLNIAAMAHFSLLLSQIQCL